MPLLFVTVRRVFGAAAGVAAAAALAVMPIDVLTSRSDTMDAVMMLLIVVALYCTVRATEGGRTRWLLAAALALGVAFNVKLFESWVAVPGLLVLCWMGLPGTRRQRLRQLGLAGLLYAVIALSWLTATLAFPAHDHQHRLQRIGPARRPAVESLPDGPVALPNRRSDPLKTNAAFHALPLVEPIANGRRVERGVRLQRIGPPVRCRRRPGRRVAPRRAGRLAEQAVRSVEDERRVPRPVRDRLDQRQRLECRVRVQRLRPPARQGDRACRGRNSTAGFPTADQTERDMIPITDPSPTRLLVRIGPLPGQRLGFEVLVALLLGGPALAVALGCGARRRRRPRAGPDDEATAAIAPARATCASCARPRPSWRSGLCSDSCWTAAWRACTPARRWRSRQRWRPCWGSAWRGSRAGAPTAVSSRSRSTLAVCVIYGERVSWGLTGAWWLTALFAGATLAVYLLGMARAPQGGTRTVEYVPAGPMSIGVAALALTAVLVIPLFSAVQTNRAHITDAGHVGAADPTELMHLSDFLRAHQGNARFEVAAASATAVGALIVRDVRPVVVLTTYNAQPLISVAEFRRLVAAGQVRYAWLNTICGPHTARTDAACSPAGLWVRRHGVDVSHQAGLPHGEILWYLPPAAA